MLRAASGTLERRANHVALLAGVRNAELRGLQGRHFMRPGFIWVSADIAKGKRERWVPILTELEPSRATTAT
jgi:integrase